MAAHANEVQCSITILKPTSRAMQVRPLNDSSSTVTARSASGSLPSGSPSRSARSAAENIDAQRSLQRLNKAFLTLVLLAAASERSPGSDSESLLGLPSTTLKLLRSLSDAGLDRLADCPYALFELPVVSSALVVSEEQRRCATALLFQAWHVAHIAPSRTMLWFCVSASAVDNLRAHNALEISVLGEANAGSLRARCGNQARYWPVMIRAVQTGNVEQLRLAQLLGRQLKVMV